MEAAEESPSSNTFVSFLAADAQTSACSEALRLCLLHHSSSAPPVRHPLLSEDHPAELLLLRPVGARQRCGRRPERQEPLHLVLHRQPRERHHVPHQGEAGSVDAERDRRGSLKQKGPHIPECSSALSGRHRGLGESRGQNQRPGEGGGQHGGVHAGRRSRRVRNRHR